MIQSIGIKRGKSDYFIVGYGKEGKKLKVTV
jgi:hypothetical protein